MHSFNTFTISSSSNLFIYHHNHHHHILTVLYLPYFIFKATAANNFKNDESYHRDGDNDGSDENDAQKTADAAHTLVALQHQCHANINTALDRGKIHLKTILSITIDNDDDIESDYGHYYQ